MPFDERALVHGRQPVIPEISGHLRASPEARRRSEAVERELAGREWPDMNHYAEAKGPTIRFLLREAGWTGSLTP